MSCLVPSCARAKFNFSRSRSGRSRSLGERLFLVLVVPRSRSFLSIKLSFLVPGRSGSLVIEFVLVPRTISNYSVLEQVCDWLNYDQSKITTMDEQRTEWTAHFIRKENRPCSSWANFYYANILKTELLKFSEKRIIRIWARNKILIQDKDVKKFTVIFNDSRAHILKRTRI